MFKGVKIKNDPGDGSFFMGEGIGCGARGLGYPCRLSVIHYT